MEPTFLDFIGTSQQSSRVGVGMAMTLPYVDPIMCIQQVMESRNAKAGVLSSESRSLHNFTIQQKISFNNSWSTQLITQQLQTNNSKYNHSEPTP